jgi:hypothetical protein
MSDINRHTCDVRPVWVPKELPCKECEADNRQKEAMGMFRDPKWLGKKAADECLVSDPPTAKSVVSWCHGDPSDAFIVSGVQRMLDLYARAAVLAEHRNKGTLRVTGTGGSATAQFHRQAQNIGNPEDDS